MKDKTVGVDISYSKNASVKDLTADGFDTGLDAKNSNSPILENIKLKGESGSIGIDVSNAKGIKIMGGSADGGSFGVYGFFSDDDSKKD